MLFEPFFLLTGTILPETFGLLITTASVLLAEAYAFRRTEGTEAL